MACVSAASARCAPASMPSCASPSSPWKVKGLGRQLASVMASEMLDVPRNATTMALTSWSNATKWFGRRPLVFSLAEKLE